MSESVYTHFSGRGGVRHVQTVHLYRAAKYQGPPHQYVYLY